MNKCRVDTVFYCSGVYCDFWESGVQMYGMPICKYYRLGKCVNKDAQEMALNNKENEK